MRNRISIRVLFVLIAFIIPVDAFSQMDEIGKWHVKTGIGAHYLNSLPEFDSASEFSTEIGYRMHTGFDVGIGYSMAWVKTIYEAGTDFAGLEGQEIHHAIRLLFSRHTTFGEKRIHGINFGTGIILVGEQRLFYDIFPTVIVETQDGEQFYQYEVQQFKQNQLFHIAGVPFNTEYFFRLHENLALGIRLEGQFLFDFGFDRFSIGPKIITFF